MLTKREFLMQAHTFKPAKNNVAGWWISEKLDGTRCFWDGGISRGVPTVEVPWANIFHPKTGKLKPRLKPIATGLWSRYANPIIAPDSFLNQLPTCFLDGELFAGNGNFQLCRSIVAGNEPGPDWDKIEFAVFGSPSYKSIFREGRINCASMVRNIYFNEIHDWIKTRRRLSNSLGDLKFFTDPKSFDSELDFLQVMLPTDGAVYLHKQRRLPTEGTFEYIEKYMDMVLANGGEGVVLRNGNVAFEPKRSHGILKYKPFHDDEATVTGFTSGRKTEKGSKFLGMIGALITDYNGKRLELSGMTNEERRFADEKSIRYAEAHPGEDMPAGTEGKYFKVGDTVSFKYREFSDAGIPKDGRYWRKR